jgi:hypothetical protein
MSKAYVEQRVRMLYLLAVEKPRHPLHSSFDAEELAALRDFIERFKELTAELKIEGLDIDRLEGEAFVGFFNKYKMSWREFTQSREINDFRNILNNGDINTSSEKKSTLDYKSTSDHKSTSNHKTTNHSAPLAAGERNDEEQHRQGTPWREEDVSSRRGIFTDITTPESSHNSKCDKDSVLNQPVPESPTAKVTAEVASGAASGTASGDSTEDSGTLWNELMDSHAEFCKHLPIKYRIGVGPHCIDKGFGPMVLTRVQAIASSHFTKDFFMDEVPVRWQVLKSRQLCFTTLLLSIEAWLICQIPKFSILFIIDKDEHMHVKRKDFIDWFAALHDEFGACVPTIIKREGRTLFFSNGSFITFESAESRNPGTGMYYNMMHWSERPKWPGDRSAQIKASLLPGLPFRKHTVLIDESTAHGLDDFKADWDELHKPQSGFNKYQMKAHFYPWTLSLEYAEEPPDSCYEYNYDNLNNPNKRKFKYLDKDESLSELDSSGSIVETESEYAAKYHLTDAQIYWRRMQIKLTFKDKTLFDQEFPTTPEHAWASIGARYVPNAVIKESLKYVKQPLFSGTIVHSGAPSKDEHFGLINAADLQPSLTQSKFGELHIYEFPVADMSYFEGGDVSEGAQKTIGNRSESDLSSVVITNEYGKVCAVYKFRIKPENFWLVLALIGKFYNYARMNCEYNNDGKTVWALLSKIGYPNFHWSYTSNGQMEDHPWVRIKPGERVSVLNIGRQGIIEDPSRVSSIWLHAEAAALVRKDAKIVEPVGEHDDVFMAYCHSEISRREITDRMIQATEVPVEKYEDNFANDTLGAMLMNRDLDPREMFEGEPNLVNQDHEFSWYRTEWAA